MSDESGDRVCVVGDGDCVLRLADRFGIPSEAVWAHSANDPLRKTRPDPTALARGDRVFVPRPRPKTSQGETDLRHDFVRKVERVKLRLLFDDGSKPMANAICKFDIEGEQQERPTNAEGIVELAVLPTAIVGTVLIVHDGRELAYTLQIGDLDVHTTNRGALQRLRNLGYFRGDIAEWSDRLANLLRRFQRAEGLAESEALDAPTAAKLRELHGG